jgi:hypothetical protein
MQNRELQERSGHTAAEHARREQAWREEKMQYERDKEHARRMAETISTRHAEEKAGREVIFQRELRQAATEREEHLRREHDNAYNKLSTELSNQLAEARASATIALERRIEMEARCEHMERRADQARSECAVLRTQLKQTEDARDSMAALSSSVKTALVIKLDQVRADSESALQAAEMERLRAHTATQEAQDREKEAMTDLDQARARLDLQEGRCEALEREVKRLSDTSHVHLERAERERVLARARDKEEERARDTNKVQMRLTLH